MLIYTDMRCLLTLIAAAPLFAQCGAPNFCLSPVGCARGHCSVLDNEGIGIQGPTPSGTAVGPVPSAYDSTSEVLPPLYPSNGDAAGDSCSSSGAVGGVVAAAVVSCTQQQSPHLTVYNSQGVFLYSSCSVPAEQFTCPEGDLLTADVEAALSGQDGSIIAIDHFNAYRFAPPGATPQDGWPATWIEWATVLPTNSFAPTASVAINGNDAVVLFMNGGPVIALDAASGAVLTTGGQQVYWPGLTYGNESDNPNAWTYQTTFNNFGASTMTLEDESVVYTVYPATNQQAMSEYTAGAGGPTNAEALIGGVWALRINNADYGGSSTAIDGGSAGSGYYFYPFQVCTGSGPYPWWCQNPTSNTNPSLTGGSQASPMIYQEYPGYAPTYILTDYGTGPPDGSTNPCCAGVIEVVDDPVSSASVPPTFGANYPVGSLDAPDGSPTYPFFKNNFPWDPNLGCFWVSIWRDPVMGCIDPLTFEEWYYLDLSTVPSPYGHSVYVSYHTGNMTVTGTTSADGCASGDGHCVLLMGVVDGNGFFFVIAVDTCGSSVISPHSAACSGVTEPYWSYPTKSEAPGQFAVIQGAEPGTGAATQFAVFSDDGNGTYFVGGATGVVAGGTPFQLNSVAVPSGGGSGADSAVRDAYYLGPATTGSSCIAPGPTNPGTPACQLTYGNTSAYFRIGVFGADYTRKVHLPALGSACPTGLVCTWSCSSDETYCSVSAGDAYIDCSGGCVAPSGSGKAYKKATATLEVALSGYDPLDPGPGVYPLQITGVDSGTGSNADLTQTITVSATVAGFALALDVVYGDSTNSVVINEGAGSSDSNPAVNIGTISAYIPSASPVYSSGSGSVTLSSQLALVPTFPGGTPGITIGFGTSSPGSSTYTINSGNSWSTNVYVSVASGTPPGTYMVWLQGTDNASATSPYSNSTETVGLAVTVAPFSISITPTCVNSNGESSTKTFTVTATSYDTNAAQISLWPVWSTSGNGAGLAPGQPPAGIDPCAGCLTCPLCVSPYDAYNFLPAIGMTAGSTDTFTVTIGDITTPANGIYGFQIVGTVTPNPSASPLYGWQEAVGAAVYVCNGDGCGFCPIEE